MLRRDALLALAAALASACAYDPPLQSVSFRVAHGGLGRDATQPLTFRTAQGWDVTLTAAEVSVGPIYFYNAAPSTGTTTANGRVVAEVLQRFTVDALAPAPVALATRGRGVSEAALSAEVRLDEAEDGPVAAAGGARTAVAHVAGTAQRGDQTVTFDGALVLPSGASSSAYAQSLQRRVQHVPAAFTPGEGGALVLRVDPTHWFDSVEFASPAGVPIDFTRTAGAIQLLSGLGASSGVFSFSWEPR